MGHNLENLFLLIACLNNKILKCYRTTSMAWISPRYHRFVLNSFTLISVHSKVFWFGQKKWRQFIVFYIDKSPLQCICVNRRFFWWILIDKWYNSMYTFNNHFFTSCSFMLISFNSKGCFSASIKLSKNFSKTVFTNDGRQYRFNNAWKWWLHQGGDVI